MAQNPPPQVRYSTHDFTRPVLTENPTNFDEWMVDVKTPGDGVTYSAGTIIVNRTTPVPTLFSDFDASPSLGLVGFDAGMSGPVLATRQVGILQITGPDQVIRQQRYFHGTTVGVPVDLTRATNVRGISVWPTGSIETTRVAICGETYDETLPHCESATTWAGASSSNSGGFIAVYDGAAELQWTWHFHGGNAGSSAVTDISIRVDESGKEVVTYCGISTHGNPTLNGTLDDLLPFAAPFAGSASGATDNGAGQWDGFVGRLERPSGGTASKVFHSVVGGVQQDGLFGLAEADPDQFVVVGSTATTGVPASGSATFPLSAVAGVGGTYSIGVMLVFDTRNLSTSGQLTLSDAAPIGDPTHGAMTVARDVLVQPRYWLGFPAAVIVGSTDDTSFYSQFLVPGAPVGPQPGHNGGVDGFVVGALLSPPALALPFWISATLRGGSGDDYLTGVSGWNEWPDYIAVTGTSDGLAGNDIDVAGYVLGTSGGTPQASLLALGQTALSGTYDDHPTAIGTTNATTLGMFSEFGLGGAQGGGVAVDSMGRVQVVGTTQSFDFAVSGAAPINYVFAAGRDKTGIPLHSSYDGTRTVLDLLPAVPVSPGFATPGAVGRTDGTGQLPTGDATGYPSYPFAGVYGGTTPECSLQPFGFQMGVTPPADHNRRMLIACSRIPDSGNGWSTDLIISRAPESFGSVSAWQLDFPGVPAPPAFLPGGTLIWTTSSPTTIAHVYGFDPTLVMPITLPAPPVGFGPVTFTAQFVSLPLTPVGGKHAGGPSPCIVGQSADFVASPGLWITYGP